MRKQDLEKLLPTESEKDNMWFEEWRSRPFKENGELYNESHKVTFEHAQKILIDYLLSKCDDLTEIEVLAIEEYKTNKLSAVKFLMAENNIGLKKAKDFLDKYTHSPQIIAHSPQLL